MRIINPKPPTKPISRQELAEIGEVGGGTNSRSFKCPNCGKTVKWYPDHNYKKFHEKGYCVDPLKDVEFHEGVCKDCHQTKPVFNATSPLVGVGEFCKDCWMKRANDTIEAYRQEKKGDRGRMKRELMREEGLDELEAEEEIGGEK